MERNERKEKLRELAKDIKTAQLIEEMIVLEEKLDELKVLEFYRVNPSDKSQVKISPAFYAYHKCLSAYKEIVKLLLVETGSNDSSPLREYLKKIKNE